jgi:nodulation protein E
MPNTVVITGLGAISALGFNTDDFWKALRQGRSGIRPMESLPTDLLKTNIGAEVPNFNGEDYFEGNQIPLFDRCTQFALIAAREAVADAGLAESELTSAATIVGTSCAAEKTYEETYRRLLEEGKPRAHPLTVPKAMHSAAASNISMEMGITGPVFTVASACASAAHSIIQAASLIRSGLVDVAIAGGTEAPLSYGLLKAWEGLRVLSSDTCRPFSSDRSGLVLGEGAGMVVLESLEHAKHRGARIYAELAGGGMSADAGHITAPSAEGAAKAIVAALGDGGVSPEEVDYVNAHGTATQANDVTETQALHMVFGDHARSLAISSTKSMHGHPLGASAGLELVATVLAMQHGLVPPTANFTSPGEGCDLDYVPNEAREMEVRNALSNSFAFGGLNAVLLVRTIGL